MNIIFVASEVGSVRAILPIYKSCINNNLNSFIINHGYFNEIQDDNLKRINNYPIEEKAIKNFLFENKIGLVIFSVNIADRLPLIYARVAHSIDIATIHVLDYWNWYSKRMMLDNKKIFKPDIYAVPDDYAKEKSISEGINQEIIEVTGQPAFSTLIDVYNKRIKKRNSNKKNLSELKHIAFVSEPVSADQGNSIEENINYRGYTEKDVLRIFFDSIIEYKKKLTISILPHPRENFLELKRYWNSLHGENVGTIIESNNNMDFIKNVDGVVGMSSTLLYESWLLGIPVFSIQPNLKSPLLKILQNKDNVEFVSETNNVKNRINSWIDRIISEDFFHDNDPNSDLNFHKNSPKRFIEIINRFKK